MPRFTSQVFNAAVDMTVDGVPASSKGMKAYVEGTLTYTPKTSNITSVGNQTNSPGVTAEPYPVVNISAQPQSKGVCGGGQYLWVSYWNSRNLGRVKISDGSFSTKDGLSPGDDGPGGYRAGANEAGTIVWTRESENGSGTKYSTDGGENWITASQSYTEISKMIGWSAGKYFSWSGGRDIEYGTSLGSGPFTVKEAVPGGSVYSCTYSDSIIVLGGMSVPSGTLSWSTNGGASWQYRDLGNLDGVAETSIFQIYTRGLNEPCVLQTNNNKIYLSTTGVQGSFTRLGITAENRSGPIGYKDGVIYANNSSYVKYSESPYTSWTIATAPDGSEYQPGKPQNTYAESMYIVPTPAGLIVATSTGDNTTLSAALVPFGGPKLNFANATDLSYFSSGDAISEVGGSATGTCFQVNGNSMDVSGASGTFTAGNSVEGPSKSVGGLRLYTVQNGVGDVTDLQASDPGFVTSSGTSPYPLQFPATFPSGNTPDAELPAGTTLTVEIEASNVEGSDTETSNVLTPTD